MLRCPKCGDDQSYVVDSRSVDGGVRRRRECCACGNRYTTYESAQETAKRTLIRDLTPKLIANIREAIIKSIKEMRD